MKDYRVFVSQVLVEDREDQLRAGKLHMLEALTAQICNFLNPRNPKTFSTKIKVEQEPHNQDVVGAYKPVILRMKIKVDFETNENIHSEVQSF